MKIHSESIIPYPVEEVYLAYRDHLPEFVPWIPDVREISIQSREEGPQGPTLHNLWIADRELPKVVAGVVKPDMMRWDDYAQWNDNAHHVDWKLVIPAFKTQVKCEGRNSMVAHGPDQTKVLLTGQLQIHLDRVPGVPGFMAKRLAPKIEDFIVKLVTPNLELTNKALGKWLDANH